MDVRNLLPVGSVVLLEDAEKELMIIGILAQHDDVQYDYMAVLYPEGYLDENTVFVFNHEDIATVKYIGYMDSSYQLFRSGLANLSENITASEQ